MDTVLFMNYVWAVPPDLGIMRDAAQGHLATWLWKPPIVRRSVIIGAIFSKADRKGSACCSASHKPQSPSS